MDFVFYILLGIAYLVMVPAAMIVAMSAKSDGREQSARLVAMLDQLGRRVKDLEARLAQAAHGAEAEQPAQAETAAPAPMVAEPVPEPVPETVAAAVSDPEPEPAPAPAKAALPPVVPLAQKAKTAFAQVERDLSSRWMMWVGGLALALGGAFLVKYSIDAGLLAPPVRIALGVLLGVLLGVGGELVRRRRGGISWLDGAPDYLPGALSAAGLFTLFASVYSAYALYDMIPALMAFILLAGISVVASGLAYLQGKFFAWLGLIGGMTVPMLVSTGNPQAAGLFPYLLFIAGASLFVARLQAWFDIAGAALGLALLWVPIWIISNWQGGDSLIIGPYLLVIGGLNAWLMAGSSQARQEAAGAINMLPPDGPSVVADLAGLAVMLFLVCLVRLEHYSGVTLGLFGAAMLGQGWLVAKNAEQDFRGLALLVGALFLLVGWHVPDMMDLGNHWAPSEARMLAIAPIAPPGFESFVTVATLMAGAVGFAIFAGLPRLLRKALWASAGVVFPLLVLVLVYVRLSHFDASFPFAAVAVLMAGLFAAAVARFNSKAGYLGPEVLAAYAAGATTALALGLAMVLRDAWLSFALALELVALGAIWQRLKVAALRPLALLLAGIVLVRLFFNQGVLGYGGLEPLPVINWLFYGYGLTAGLFALSARLFGDVPDRLNTVLRVGAVALVAAFTTLEIRVLFGANREILGDVTAVEAAAQSINWAVLSAALFWRELKTGDALLTMLRRGMTAISLMGLLMAGGRYNALVNGDHLGTLPILNLQFLQLLVPGLIYAAKARLAGRHGRDQSARVYGIVALALVWVWATAEVRHGFHPTGVGYATGWEWYSYSAVWLVYALALLLAGLWRNHENLRLAGLGMMGLVVLKVFLFDMSSLEGMARAISFMGLGAALIGMGYLYQRLRRLT